MNVGGAGALQLTAANSSAVMTSGLNLTQSGLNLTTTSTSLAPSSIGSLSLSNILVPTNTSL